MMLTDRELQSLRNLGNEAEAAADVLAAVKERLGLTDHDANTDVVAVIDMLKSWEADATRRADRLAQHLRNVLEIARTWQPDYATKMDRDTLDLAASEIEPARVTPGRAQRMREAGYTRRPSANNLPSDE